MLHFTMDLWKEIIDIEIDLTKETLDESLVTWSSFRAIYDLNQLGCVPSSLLKIAEDVPDNYICWENVNNLDSPIYTAILDELWLVWEDNYFETDSVFQYLFCHYFTCNYLVPNQTLPLVAIAA